MSALAEPVRVRVGPLCMVVPVGELEAWVRDAKPGHRFTYAKGQVLAHGERTVIAARDYYDAGLVQLLSKVTTLPDGRRETEWFVERRNAVAALAVAVTRIEPDCPADAEELAAILREFSRAANFRLVAPTNGELADRLNLNGARRVRYLVGKLIRDRAIRVVDQGPRARRIVTIMSTGKSTVPGRL